MYLIKAVIDFIVILLLVRLIIKPNEAYFHPIYRLIYRITDPVLVPARAITSGVGKAVVLSLVALLVLRGLVYVGMGSTSLLSGIGLSFHSLFKLLFQVYMILWFVSVLSERAFGSATLNFIQRAFLPLHRVSGRFGVQRRHFHLFAFLFLWILYGLVSLVIRYALEAHSPVGASSVTPLSGFVEGLILIIGLFPFPGFFSLIIVVGALMSWVSPDPSNPIVQAIYGISEPLLQPFRRYVPLIGGIDVSPIVALLCFQLLGTLAYQLLSGLIRMGG